MISRILRKNTSRGRIAGFALSNLLGLVIMGVGLQFFLDARSIWERDDSFMKSDYMAVNKIVDASNTLRNASSDFTAADVADLEAQPWVKKAGAFTRADFRVYAGVALGGAEGRRMSTAMFFEAVPDDFLDVGNSGFFWNSDEKEVPIIISKDYLALYNFGFAGAAGLPQMSESLISGIPLQLTLSSEDGGRRVQMYGRIAGYSNRFNTILVPQAFLDEMNKELGSGRGQNPSRLIVDVNSPGDAAIAPYLKSKGWETAGDKRASSAAYLLRIVSGIVMAIGCVITVLSLFILLLSMSLLMEKNRRKLHSLLMLGYPVKTIAAPYALLSTRVSVGAGVLASAAVAGVRAFYIGPLRGLGAEGGSVLWSLLLIAALTGVIVATNIVAIRRRVIAAWR